MLLFPDRFWWLQRCGGLLLAIGCFIAMIYVAIQAYDAYQVQVFLLVGVACVFWGVQGILFIRESFRSRERFHRRVCAIGGDQEAMLRARVKVDAEQAPELSSEPLELLWRATPSNSRVMTPLTIIFLVIFSPFIIVFLYLAYCLATNTAPIGSVPLAPLSPLERAGVAAVVVLRVADC
jgi:hypothetical protein